MIGTRSRLYLLFYICECLWTDNNNLLLTVYQALVLVPDVDVFI